ncbi:MAG TPA: hypothetical protein VLA15_03225 [Desulfurivibrionaceae bacterium]|nr:hypothetical protein [Desulfurivibrionaceae bacterium]
MRALPLLLLATLLGGCAAHLRPAPAASVMLPSEPTLWKLALRRGGEPLYTGLLLLSRGEEGAGVVLLDATGIKLLEGRVAESGEMIAVKALRPVADRGLPDFLGRVVQRLFLLAPPPVGETCRPEGFGKLCQGINDAGQLVRIRGWGPFVLWAADYSINNEVAPPLLTTARMGQGWLAPEVGLERRLEAGE